MTRSLRIGALLLTLLLAGCETLSYYGKGVAGQVRFYGAREPIPEVLKKPGLAPETRRRLELVPQIMAFAQHELELPVTGQYRDFVQLDTPNVAWNVFAAPELALEPYRWCYLFHALCVEYRGYFSEADAVAYADRLEAQGFDTYVGGVSAFSSLGLLDDPVTSVLTAYPDDLLALVLFHELAHAVLYVKDDTAFNESFAEAVAEESLRRWLLARGGGGDSATVRQLRAKHDVLVTVALATREQLAELYRSDQDAAGKRAGKQQILAAARADYRRRCGDDCPFSHWFGPGLNNARLNSVATYQHWVPAFTALMASHRNDLPAFFRTVQALAKVPRQERDAILQALLPAAPAAPDSAATAAAAPEPEPAP